MDDLVNSGFRRNYANKINRNEKWQKNEKWKSKIPNAFSGNDVNWTAAKTTNWIVIPNGNLVLKWSKKLKKKDEFSWKQKQKITRMNSKPEPISASNSFDKRDICAWSSIQFKPILSELQQWLVLLAMAFGEQATLQFNEKKN